MKKFALKIVGKTHCECTRSTIYKRTKLLEQTVFCQIEIGHFFYDGFEESVYILKINIGMLIVDVAKTLNWKERNGLCFV